MPIYGATKTGGELDFWQSYLATYFANTGTVAASNPYFVLVKRDNPLVIGHFDIFVASASGNVDVGLYTYNGTNMVPIWTAGTTAMAGTNALQSFTVSPTYNLAAGASIYAAVALDNATATIARVGGLAQLNLVGFQALSKGATYPLPTASSAVSSGAGNIPWIRLRA